MTTIPPVSLALTARHIPHRVFVHLGPVSSLEQAEEEFYLDANGWSLLYYPVRLSEAEFAVQEESASYSIDVQGKRLVERFLGSQLELDLNSASTEWTELQLSRWLDKRLRQDDIRQEILLEFCRSVVNHLVKVRKLPMAALVRTRYPLAKVMLAKIGEYRSQALTDGYQNTLFGPAAAVETRYDFAFNFESDVYPAHWNYDGSFQFNKHFYATVGELESEGEEFECAQALDRTYPVEYWVRNLAAQPNFSFRLPLATGSFYPAIPILSPNCGTGAFSSWSTKVRIWWAIRTRTKSRISVSFGKKRATAKGCF